ncbi:Uncharacterised protein [Candidatus Venteria ishoeyi]|uniref:Uncharacterized protein n=1 Tax=Candidatus Venteria ishoeyi TaxID=1899563 RepID=A0A1H6F5S5_9GAMM|nr:Uncharacterised protein [Candidatus Venteria ishoeyi]
MIMPIYRSHPAKRLTRFTLPEQIAGSETIFIQINGLQQPFTAFFMQFINVCTIFPTTHSHQTTTASTVRQHHPVRVKRLCGNICRHQETLIPGQRSLSCFSRPSQSIDSHACAAASLFGLGAFFKLYMGR